jgi:glutathione S-transferase
MIKKVQTGSFVIRGLTLPKYGVGPSSLLTALETRAPNYWKWANAVVNEKSVNYIFDEKLNAERTKTRLAKQKAAAK